MLIKDDIYGGMVMKKDRIIKLCMTICLIFGISIMPVNQLEIKANEIIATVQGTISSGTTSDLLRLSTPQGNMETVSYTHLDVYKRQPMKLALFIVF